MSVRFEIVAGLLQQMYQYCHRLVLFRRDIKCKRYLLRCQGSQKGKLCKSETKFTVLLPFKMVQNSS